MGDEPFDVTRLQPKPRTTVKRFAAEVKARIAKLEAAFTKPGQEDFCAGVGYIQGVVDALLSDYDVRDPEDWERMARGPRETASAPVGPEGVREPFDPMAYLKARMAAPADSETLREAHAAGAASADARAREAAITADRWGNERDTARRQLAEARAALTRLAAHHDPDCRQVAQAALAAVPPEPVPGPTKDGHYCKIAGCFGLCESGTEHYPGSCRCDVHGSAPATTQPAKGWQKWGGPTAQSPRKAGR